ncbi:hypothetical protein NQ318_003888 [Aromia moschata]|uniref:Uncharacterized protein n=1 Tax=Aromia moschata TaxID=1265417 RepID=A0AAV8Z963_9CUCU|nr:hypothetical protein NQ318_003888 [Aromia moschata]
MRTVFGRNEAPSAPGVRKFLRKVRETGMLMDNRSHPRARLLRTAERIAAVAQNEEKKKKKKKAKKKSGCKNAAAIKEAVNQDGTMQQIGLHKNLMGGPGSSRNARASENEGDRDLKGGGGGGNSGGTDTLKRTQVDVNVGVARRYDTQFKAIPTALGNQRFAQQAVQENSRGSRITRGSGVPYQWSLKLRIQLSSALLPDRLSPRKDPQATVHKLLIKRVTKIRLKEAIYDMPQKKIIRPGLGPKKKNPKIKQFGEFVDVSAMHSWKPIAKSRLVETPKRPALPAIIDIAKFIMSQLMDVCNCNEAGPRLRLSAYWSCAQSRDESSEQRDENKPMFSCLNTHTDACVGDPPSDYYLFVNLKKMLAGKRYGFNEEVIAETEAYFERVALGLLWGEGNATLLFLRTLGQSAPAFLDTGHRLLASKRLAQHGTVAEVAVLGVAVWSRMSLLWLQMSKKTLKHQPDDGPRNWASVDGLYSEFW